MRKSRTTVISMAPTLFSYTTRGRNGNKQIRGRLACYGTTLLF